MDESLLRATVSIRGVVSTPDGEVLVVRRSSDGGWELPGGRVREGETVTDCLRRELDEETGLHPSIHRPIHAVTWRNDDGYGRFAVYYHCSADRDRVSTSDEHVDCDWTSPQDAKDRLSAPQETAVTRATAIDERRILE